MFFQVLRSSQILEATYIRLPATIHRHGLFIDCLYSRARGACAITSFLSSQNVGMMDSSRSMTILIDLVELVE